MAEPKVILFPWTVMHEKVLTAGILEAMGWDNNVICPLCLQELLETNYHLLIDCPFARKVLHLVNTWQDGPNLIAMPATTRVANWLQHITNLMTATQRREQTGRILYTWWNISKERNQRIFQGKESNSMQVALRAKEEADFSRMAITAGRRSPSFHPLASRLSVVSAFSYIAIQTNIHYYKRSLQ